MKRRVAATALGLLLLVTVFFAGIWAARLWHLRPWGNDVPAVDQAATPNTHAAPANSPPPPANPPSAASTPSTKPAIAAIWLRGKLAVDFDDGPARHGDADDFEILLDGGNRYYCRTWHGKPAALDGDSYERVEIVLPYWQGRKSESWSMIGGGRGGGSSGFENTQNVLVPGRRLWLAGGPPGAQPDQLVCDRTVAGLHEEFVDLKDHAGVLIPTKIVWREHYMLPRRTFTYTITDVQFLPTTQLDTFTALTKKYFGDTRAKNSTYPDGSKREEHIYLGDLPVLNLQWFQDGQLQSAEVFANGLRTTRLEWYPDGKKKIEERLGVPYTWTAWGPDGAISSEGEQVFGEQGAMTGWMNSYYPGGQKKEVRHETNSLLDGVFRRWDENGQLIDDGVYQNGHLWSGMFLWIHTGEHGSHGASDGTVHYYTEGMRVAAPQTPASRPG